LSSGLQGKRVLVARAEAQSDKGARLLEEREAIPVVIPAIAIVPAHDTNAVRARLTKERLAGTDWVVFTSANGILHTWRAVGDEGLRALEDVRVAVVGPLTEEALRAHGRAADLVAHEFRGEALAAALLEATTTRPMRVLVLRAEEASEVLPTTLRSAGVEVDVVAVYRTIPHVEGTRAIAQLLDEGSLDAVIFTSGSTLNAVCDALGPAASDRLASVAVACIGPVTRDAAYARGVKVDVVSGTATFAAAIEALDRWFQAI
jgi:uroporphyrinogen-III synthase